MDVGVLILPEHRWVEAEPLWHKAEDLGFAHVWTYDHLAWRTLADHPWHAAVPALAAAAWRPPASAWGRWWRPPTSATR